MRTAYVVAGGVVVAGLALILWDGRKREILDQRIDPNDSTHRQIPAMFAGVDQVSTRMPSKQDPKGGLADYGGYPYGGSMPSRVALAEPAQGKGAWWDKGEDRWNEVLPGPLDYGLPPLRIPRIWRDGNRYWDGITSHGGTEQMGQRVHLFHFRPAPPTRGYRSISGSVASIGGGQSTASRVRIPAIFIPSGVA